MDPVLAWKACSNLDSIEAEVEKDLTCMAGLNILVKKDWLVLESILLYNLNYK